MSCSGAGVFIPPLFTGSPSAPLALLHRDGLNGGRKVTVSPFRDTSRQTDQLGTGLWPPLALHVSVEGGPSSPLSSFSGSGMVLFLQRTASEAPSGWAGIKSQVFQGRDRLNVPINLPTGHCRLRLRRIYGVGGVWDNGCPSQALPAAFSHGGL